MPQPFTTTVVGSLPKPAWLYQQRPLAGPGTDHHGSGADWNFEAELLAQAQDDATRLAIHIQEAAGLDIISDGEQRRKSTSPTSQTVSLVSTTKRWQRNGSAMVGVWPKWGAVSVRSDGPGRLRSTTCVSCCPRRPAPLR